MKIIPQRPFFGGRSGRKEPNQDDAWKLRAVGVQPLPPVTYPSTSSRPLDVLLETLKVNPETGLTLPDAEERLKEHGPNEIERDPPVPYLKRFVSQFTNPFSFLLVGAAGASAILREVLDAVGIGVVSLANAAIGFSQELAAERSLKALLSLSVQEARVRRDGKMLTLPARQLVPGDIVYLKQGDMVPADARLIQSQDLQTSESALTGESTPVSKDPTVLVPEHAPLHEKKNMVFSGTGVINGSAKAVVCSTGMQTEIGDIVRRTRKARPSRSSLEKSLDKVARHLMILGVGSSVPIGLVSGLAGGSLLSALPAGISMLVAVVPESLPTVMTLVLANGVLNAKRNNVLIRKLPSVETLGSTTVICTDKTGTLTAGEMEGKKIWTPSPEMEKWVMLAALLGNSAEKDQHGWVGNPTETAAIKFIENMPDLYVRAGEKTGQKIRVTVRFSDRAQQDFLLSEKEYALIGDLIREGKGSESVIKLSSLLKERARDYPFSSDRKLHTMAFPGEVMGQEGYVSFTTGAPDTILPRTALSEAEKEEIARQNDALAREGYRVIAMAYRRVPVLGDAGDMEKELTFSGLLAIQDPLRKGVPESVAQLRQAGIKTVVITGDQFLTARAIAQGAGILEPGKSLFVFSDDLLETLDPASPEGRKNLEIISADARNAEALMMSGRWMDLFREKHRSAGPMSGVLPYEDLVALIPKVKVFYRVEPRHKLRIVETLQDVGEVVGMTGDGVNDAPAIRKANIGIAMGIRGTDMAKEAADMVLTDDSFNSIASGVKAGRVIYSNIRKFLAYIISSNLGEVFAVGVTSAAGLAIPGGAGPLLTPLQLLWINLTTDSLPALGLGMEKAEPGIMDSLPNSKGKGLLPRRKLLEILSMAAYIGGVGAALYFAAPLLGATAAEAQAMSFNFLVLSQLVNAINARTENPGPALKGISSNKLLVGSVLGTAALQAALPFIPGVGEALRAIPLHLWQWALMGGLAALVLPLGQFAKRLTARVTRHKQEIHAGGKLEKIAHPRVKAWTRIKKIFTQRAA